MAADCGAGGVPGKAQRRRLAKGQTPHSGFEARPHRGAASRQAAHLSSTGLGKLLQGSGKSARHVVLHDLTYVDSPAILVLLDTALGLASRRPVAGAEIKVILKGQGQQQRAARAIKAARHATETGAD